MSLWRGQLHHVAQDVGIPPHVRAAVEVEHFTGQPGRLAQEHHGVGDVLGSAGAAQRCVLHISPASHALTLPAQRAILAAVVDVTVLPGRRGPQFDAASIVLDFKA